MSKRFILTSVIEKKKSAIVKSQKNLILPKFIKFLMKNGEKAKALNIYYYTLYLFKKKLVNSLKSITKKNLNFCSLQMIILAVNNVKPSLDIRQIRVAGITYQVPIIISEQKQESLSIKWILHYAKKRQKLGGINFSECLAQELFDAFNKQGLAINKRDEIHKVAEANRAFIRYRWW